MRVRSTLRYLRRLLVATVTLLGCSNTPSTVDAGDFGPYPAQHPSLPQVDLSNSGGTVINAPKLVAITYADDALRPQVEQFVQAIGPSAYWGAVTSEYAVGAATALSPVELTDTSPATIGDAQIQTYLTNLISAAPANSPLANVDESTILVVFFTEKTVVSAHGGKSCSDFGGYHSSMPVLQNALQFQVPYAVVPRCPGFYQLSTLLDATTAVASHELVETATDPEPNLLPAYDSVSNEDYAWAALLNGGEVGDMCVYPHAASPFFQPQGLAYQVQRTWSNAAAAQGTDPCVPAPSGPYFNAMPVLNDSVTLTGLQGTFAAKGVLIPIGGSATIVVDLFSTDATHAPWQVTATDYGALHGTAPHLQFQFDSPSGQNGQKLNLTITVVSAGPMNGEPFLLESSLNGQTNFSAGLVGQQ